MCRLAVDCGCVQDAATELILPVLKFDTAQAALVAAARAPDRGGFGRRIFLGREKSVPATGVEK